MADIYTIETLASASYTNTSNYVLGSAPSANDNVFFQHNNTLDGSDQSATELDDIHVLPTCIGTIGTADTYLQLDQGTTNSTYFAGRGASYIDLGTAGSALVRVTQTKGAANGQAGLYLKNNTNAITLMEVRGGVVRLVEANITTLVVGQGATVYIDSTSTVATIDNAGGTVIDYGAAINTVDQSGGTMMKSGDDAYSLNLYGGTFFNDGTGAATVVQYGGDFDSARDPRGKNVTLTLNGGAAVIGANVNLTDTFNATTTISA